MSDVQRTGRVDTDEFHLDLFTLAHVIVTEEFSFFENPVNLLVQPCIFQGKINEPGRRHFCALNFLSNGQQSHQFIGNHHRIGPGNSRQLQREIRSIITVSGILRALDGNFRQNY